MTDHYSEYWTRDDFVESADAEIAALRAENERLRAEIWQLNDWIAASAIDRLREKLRSYAPPTDTRVF
jgi:cell division protein FtsB